MIAEKSTLFQEKFPDYPEGGWLVNDRPGGRNSGRDSRPDRRERDQLHRTIPYKVSLEAYPIIFGTKRLSGWRVKTTLLFEETAEFTSFSAGRKTTPKMSALTGGRTFTGSSHSEEEGLLEQKEQSHRLAISGLFHLVDCCLIRPVFADDAAVINQHHPVHATGDTVIDDEAKPLPRPHLLQTYPYVPVPLSTVTPVITHGSLLFSHWG